MRPDKRLVGVIFVVLAQVAVFGAAKIMGGSYPHEWFAALATWALLIGIIGLFMLWPARSREWAVARTLAPVSTLDIESHIASRK